MNILVHVCAIDYHKAFDCVRHDKMVEILNKTVADRKDIHIKSVNVNSIGTKQLR